MSYSDVEKIRREWPISDNARDEGLCTPDDITRYDDIIYGPDYDYNRLDVYMPKGTTSPQACIISVHGGAWCYGDKELYQHYCMSLAQRGFTVVNFSYRLAPENKYPAQLEDCLQVINWIVDNHQEYMIDMDKIFMVGDSAGGQLCLQLCTALTNPNYAALCGLKFPEEFSVKAIALNCGVYFFPLLGVVPIKYLSVIEDYLPIDYRRVIPELKMLKNMSASFPPCFVMTGYYDFLKRLAPRLVKRLKKVGIQHEYLIYGDKSTQEATHVFHLNCKSDLAAKCNDDECEFFRKYIR